MATLGEKLREAREARGYTLREVADNTRISVRHLEAIEADDYRPLPGGVFNKGFIKAFARYVGIDEAEALSDYTKQVGQQGLPTGDDEAPLSRRHEVFVGDEPRRPLLTLVLALIILGLLTWGVIAALQWYQNRNNQTIAAASPTPTPAVNTNADPTPTPTPVVSAASGLKIEVKAGAQDVPITAFIDGKAQAPATLQPGSSQTFNATQSFKLRYSRYRIGELQMTINGQPAKVPTTSSNPKLRNTIEFEVNPNNLAQFFQ
ncbi:MAG: helix-turn-helix domain-containing protein [Acidobacteriota bacterium]|nr:helix-turn-helix domain-containing protein [Acidobacteriota bacterium]